MPQGVDSGVFPVKYNQHRGGGHTSTQGAAVEIFPKKRDKRASDIWSGELTDSHQVESNNFKGGKTVSHYMIRLSLFILKIVKPIQNYKKNTMNFHILYLDSQC